MKIQFLPFLALLAFLGTACNPTEAPKDDHDHAGHAAVEETHDHDHGHADEVMAAVQLDNGETWEANPETTEGIEAMSSIVAGFDSATGDGQVFKEELQTEFRDIFAKCTMTGEAHEQLHNYLLPLKNMLEGLDENPTEDQLASLREYLETYGDYFH